MTPGQGAAVLPGAKTSSQIVAANGFVYAIGGHTGTTADSSVYRYDPAANSWAAVASLPVLDSGQAARYGGSAVELNGKLYLIGGWRISPPLPTSSLQIYDPSTNTWSEGASLPRLSGCSRAGVINARIYVLTPCDGYSGYRSKLDIYDPATNTWTAGPDAPTAHADALVASSTESFTWQAASIFQAIRRQPYTSTIRPRTPGRPGPRCRLRERSPAPPSSMESCTSSAGRQAVRHLLMSWCSIPSPARGATVHR